MRPPTPPSHPSTGARTRKKRRRLRLRRKKKKEQYDQIIDTIPPNEMSSLVLHAMLKEPSPAEAHLEEAKTILFVSHLVAKFSEFWWQFCLILFLTALTNYKSLCLVSTYGLFTGLVVCLSGPSTGALVDSKDNSRLYIAKLFIWTQNLSVILATTCCFLLLRLVPPTNGDEESTIENTGTAKIMSEILPDLAPSATWNTWVLIVAVHLFGALGKLTDQSMTVAMERDWIVVMSKVAGGNNHNDNNDSDSESEYLQSCDSMDSGVSSLSVGNASYGSHTDLNDDILRKLKEKTWLSQTNTVMMQIDLICRIAAPAAAGIFFGYFDDYKPGSSDYIGSSHWNNLSYAAVIIGILNLISLLVEYNLIQQIYELVPLLSVRKDEGFPQVVHSDKLNIPSSDETSQRQLIINSHHVNPRTITRNLSTIQSIESGKLNYQPAKEEIENKEDTNISCQPSSLPRGLSLYVQQSIFLGGFSLSLLYLNILSFGALMTAYLVWRGLSYETIGTLRGISAIIGLMGTIAFRISSRKHSLSFTGAWSIIFQFSCLSICYASLYVSNDTLSMGMLIIGVIASRIGLYVFDLTITQLMQQMIPENIRGVVGGVQKSLNSMFDLTTYGLGLIFADPNEFYILVATGYISVGIAMVIYLLWIYFHKDAIKNS